MSHYSVAIIHKESQSIEDLLAPFDENLSVKSHIRFTKEQAISYAREWILSKDDTRTDEECWKLMAEDADDGMIDPDGNIWTTSNPDAKWNWYTIGGRFSDHLRLKNGERTDSAPINEIDFSRDEDAYNRAIRFWEVYVEGQQPKEGEKIFSIYKREYYETYFGDKETYANAVSQFSTFAVLTSYGEWHEKGEMGWFGVSTETPEENKRWAADYKKRFIDNVDPDCYITIVDCHI